jgi:hypothetical protein
MTRAYEEIIEFIAAGTTPQSEYRRPTGTHHPKSGGQAISNPPGLHLPRQLGTSPQQPQHRARPAPPWLTRQGVSAPLIDKTLRASPLAAALSDSQTLYDANKAVYSLLRYGVKVKAGAGEQTQTVAPGGLGAARK